MPLESLLELVKTLSDRIDEHGPALRQSEALTRYALIDPLLRELGWDTEDPDMVIPEYRSGNGRADYALMNDGSPAMMVEAKSLGTPLRDTVLSQGINYCLMEGTSYFSVTDGRIWEIYETHKPVPIDEKRIVQFDLKDNPAQSCLSALALWRPSMESGNVSVAQTPAIEITQPNQNSPGVESPPIKESTIQTMSAISVTHDGASWQPLSGFDTELGSPAPIEMLLPDNTNVQMLNWKSVIVEVTKWLVVKNLLGSGDCPIQSPGARRRYIVHTAPIHKSGKEFVLPVEAGSLYIETHLNVREIIDKTCHIIKHVGQDASQFKIRLP